MTPSKIIKVNKMELPGLIKMYQAPMYPGYQLKVTNIRVCKRVNKVLFNLTAWEDDKTLYRERNLEVPLDWILRRQTILKDSK